MFASKRSSARLARVALAAAAIASFTPARAAGVSRDEAPSTSAAARETKPNVAMRGMDADGDGYVTREEFLKLQEALFATIDRDGDRRLSAPEFTDRG